MDVLASSAQTAQSHEKKPTASQNAAPVPALLPAGRRLTSVDALRGFDMFWIIGGREAFLALVALFIYPLPGWLTGQFEHVEWEGFVAWDMIMPLFLFVTGVSMPFSFAKWSSSKGGKKQLYLRLLRRLLLLWVLGMAVQGNLLDYDLSRLHLFSNTLQAIAAGYLISTVFLLALPLVGQIAGTAALLLVFWGAIEFIPLPNAPAGTLEPWNNLALHIDTLVLGSFRDGTTYTWVFSSLGFGATVMLGAFAGHVLRSGLKNKRKALALAAMGVGCLAAGWLWSYWFPVIKHIWTGSMVFWAGGWSYLLLAGFFWLVDVKGYRRWAFPLTIIGMNAIAVYVATHVFNFGLVSGALIGDLTPRLGRFGDFLLAFATLLVPWLILLYMYRKKTFIRI